MSWPLPSKTPNTFVPGPFGSKLPPYPRPLKFVGATIDSSDLADHVGGVHALRARIIRYYPAPNRVVQIQGPRIASYIADRLFARLGQAMQQTNAGSCLPPDFFFRFPDSEGGDVRDVLYDIDVDDRGFVAGAFDPYGCVLLDETLNVLHKFREGDSALAAKRIRWRREGSRHLVDVYPQLGEPRTFDATDPRNPTRITQATPLPTPRSHESSVGAWSITFGPDPDLPGHYGNVKLFKNGVRVPLLVPGTNLEYFAAVFNSAYARGGGFAAPSFVGLFGGEDMTDAQLLGLPDGRVLLAVAGGGLGYWYELELGAAAVVVEPQKSIAINVSGKLAVGSFVTFSVVVAPGDTVAWHFSDGLTLTGPNRLRIFTKKGTVTVDVEVTHGVAVTKTRTAIEIA